jgi:tetratricopeptide (TPR) repeat protein
MNNVKQLFTLLAGIWFITSFNAYSQTRGSESVPIMDVPYKKVHGLMVGISKYAEITSLDYADNDAQLMGKIIGTSFSGQEGTIITLTNENATEFSILSAITKIRRDAQDGDLVVIYLAGHGDVAEGISGANEGYFLAHNASASREYELGGSVAFERIIKFIDGLTARNIKVWLITDACRSGKIIDAKGASSTLTALINGYQNTTKFISCQSNELSYEYDSLQHGVFTYYFAKGISGEADTEEVDGIISVEELNRYLTSKVRSVTGKRQTPTIHAADKYAEILAVNPEFKNMLANANKDLAYADTGKKRGDDDLKKTSAIIAFEDAVIEGKLYGNGGAAYELLIAAKNNQSASKDDLEFMEEYLLNALMQRVQYISNIFLSGRPTIGKNEDFNTAISDLECALKLLNKDHPLYDKLTHRKQFFEAMEIVRTEQYDKYPATEKLLLSLEKSEPNAAYIHEGLAMLYIAMNNKEKAEGQLAKAEAKINTWSKPKNTAAHLNIVAGKLDKAEEIIAGSAEVSKDPNEIILLRAQLYTAGSALRSAEEELAKFDGNAEMQTTKEYLMLQAQVNKLRGRIRVAEDFYLQALKQDKNNVDLMVELADIYKNDGDTVNALKYYTMALSIKPNHAPAINNIALLNKQTLSAKSININLYNKNQVIGAIEQLVAQNLLDDALGLLNKAMQINNWDPEYHHIKGRLLFGLDKNKEAEASWKTALNLSPNHMESAMSLSYLLLRTNRSKEAEALIEKHNKYFAQSSRWQLFKYDILKRIHTGKDYSDLLKEAIRVDSLDIEIYESLYQIDINSSNYKGAYDNYLKIIRLGGRMQDSTQFVTAIITGFEKEIDRKNNSKAVEAYKILRNYDSGYIARVLRDATRFYHDLNYKASMTKLNQFKRYLFMLVEEDQAEYYRMNGYLLLEMGSYQEAIENFKLVNRLSRKTAFLGIAMALYELKEGEQFWREYFRKDPEVFKFNEPGARRYKLMNQNMGMHGGYRR